MTLLILKLIQKGYLYFPDTVVRTEITLRSKAIKYQKSLMETEK